MPTDERTANGAATPESQQRRRCTGTSETLHQAPIPSQEKRVLIVEDDDHDRQFMSRVFEGFRFEHAAVRSGEDAVAAARERRFDLAFIDMILPGINGLETLRQLQEITPGIKAVVCSGYGAEDLISDACNCGAIARLEKPLMLADILKVIRSLT